MTLFVVIVSQTNVTAGVPRFSMAYDTGGNVLVVRTRWAAEDHHCWLQWSTQVPYGTPAHWAVTADDRSGLELEASATMMVS